MTIKELIEHFKKLGVYVAVVGSSPFLLSMASVSPPWPKNALVITSVTQMMVFMVFAIGQNKKRSIRASRRLIILLGASVFATAAMYLTVFATFTFSIQGQDSAGVAGFVCTREAIIVQRGACSFEESLRGLPDVEYEAERIWTRWSVVIVKLVMFGSWSAACVLLAAFIAVFIGVAETDRKRRERTRVPSTTTGQKEGRGA